MTKAGSDLHFDFATAGRILFGCGVAGRVPTVASSFGRRILVVTGKRQEPAQALFSSNDLECSYFSVPGEPTVEIARSGAMAARDFAADVVVAVGGGSVIDAGKAIAALAANSRDVLDYLEVVGAGLPLTQDPLPCIAVPTTAGTGSEVTRNAVLASTTDNVKASLRHPRMLPRAAVVDPELTLSLPPDWTAFTGLDALTQLIEPAVSSRANSMTAMFCREGIQTALASLPRAFADGSDLNARRGMSWASLLGGLSLANAGLGVIHGLAAPIGGAFPAPHGAVCAAMLPAGCRVNVKALSNRAPNHPALARYSEIAALFSSTGSGRPEDLAEALAGLCQRLAIPGLRHWGIGDAHVPALAKLAMKSSSMKANPIPLTIEEVTECLASSL